MKTVFAILAMLLSILPYEKVVSCHLYAMSAIVTEVDYKSDTVYLESRNGNLWAFTGCEDWQEDDHAALIMSDNGTAEVKDDIIISAKYEG